MECIFIFRLIYGIPSAKQKPQENLMLNNCEYFGNYFSVKSFHITFAAENFENLEKCLQNKLKKNER